MNETFSFSSILRSAISKFYSHEKGEIKLFTVTTLPSLKMKIKCFKLLKSSLKVLGIVQWQGSSISAINLIQNISYLLLFTQFTITAFWYVIFDAKNFNEFGQSLFFAASGVLTIPVYIILSTSLTN